MKKRFKAQISFVLAAVLSLCTAFGTAMFPVSTAAADETVKTTYLYDSSVYKVTVDGKEIENGEVIESTPSDTVEHTLTVTYDVQTSGVKWADHGNGVAEIYAKRTYSQSGAWTIYDDGSCEPNDGTNVDEWNVAGKNGTPVKEVTAGTYTYTEKSTGTIWKLTLNAGGTGYVLDADYSSTVAANVYEDGKLVKELTGSSNVREYTYKITKSSQIAIARSVSQMTYSKDNSADYGTSWEIEYPEGYSSTIPYGSDYKFIIRIKEGYRNAISMAADGTLTNLEVYCGYDTVNSVLTEGRGFEDVMTAKTTTGGHFVPEESDPKEGIYVFQLDSCVCVTKLWVGSSAASTATNMRRLIADKFDVNFYLDSAKKELYTTLKDIEFGSEINEPARPTKEGKAFSGWVDEEGNKITFPWKVSTNEALIATWSDTCMVTFNYNNGAEPYTTNVNMGSKVRKPADPTKEGYTFTGWYTDEACTEAFDFNSEVKDSIILYAGWKEDGTVNGISMYRLYNPNSGEHLYTSSKSEVDNLVPLGWQFEDVAWVAPETSDTPVYRVYNPNNGDHHYTTDVKEKEWLVSLGWQDENIAWYSGGSVAVYRLFNPNAATATHHYTGFESEKNWLVGIGWQDEDIAWYAISIPEK